MTIYSTNNPPTGFYVYLYLREDRTPYYVGKGSGNRAWNKGKGEVYPPTNPELIVIAHEGLTELWSLAMERWYIRWYGRIDIGSGILRNKTDGGDGVAGAKRNESTKQKMRKPKPAGFGDRISKALTGRIRSETHQSNLNKAREGIYTPEVCKKISVALTGRVQSADHKRKNSESNKGMRFWNNGKTLTRAKTCPGEGWILGMLPKTSTG